MGRIRTAGLVGLVLVLVGLGWGAATLWAQGPVGPDVALTRGAQALFGAEAPWAGTITSLAKAPLLWGSLAVGAVLAWLVGGGWRGALAVPMAWALAWLADKALRAVMFAPKPDPELIDVVSRSAASGLPSTFGLVWGAVFGVALWVRMTGPASLGRYGLIAAVLVVGMLARVVPGGHWPSQMVASTLVGVGLAGLAYACAKRVLGRRGAAQD
jgi:hypothetical protein